MPDHPPAELLPPDSRLTPYQWLQRNLFNTWYNSLLTLTCAGTIAAILWFMFNWAITQAEWAVVQQNLPRFLVGRYPPALYWRLWLVLALVVGMGIWIASRKKAQTKLNLVNLALPALLFLVMLWLIGGGLGLTPVKTNLWNGLLLTLLLSAVSIVLAFPLGVLLALGRQSSLPLLRGFSTTYIEILRGLPLIGVLFMAQVMLPLVLPADLRLDRLLRAIAGLVLFNAAYLAENVRGGLQSVPRGQIEAAQALGFNIPLTLLLIVLPQALRTVIPAIVGQFISLIKDTSLLSLFALLELTGIARSILAQPQFLGHYTEVYLFIGLIYWFFCFTLSHYSRRLE
uniref:Polar amino acid ABC transporter, inner membrane subunit n=1 Tax=Cyanothece sp. (strain PCC 7425 / ATCC 29141) TaxID=395961 RepID=B8HLA3_CYAP4